MEQSAQSPVRLDPLDRRIISALAASPRLGVLELSRRLGVARNTAQARLDKLVGSGVISGFGPDVDLARVGYRVSAYVTLQIAQGRGRDVTDHLASIPQVVEVHRTTGAGDLLCRVVARDNAHLAEVLDEILEVSGIDRTTTALVLDSPVRARVLPAIDDLDPKSGSTPVGRTRPAT
ncbi:MAG TPA: Lrp/AsnC family transcriptional regulator [Acidimicrobiales bacterium]|nr:Lrp/AsnC family transcriptional regulator [Acidimicrobiales bacterium]